MARFTGMKVKLQLPIIGGVEGGWVPDEQDKKAAWELYVELVTRISLTPLSPDEGLLREALSSLHSLFGTTRKILCSYGPAIARPKKKGELTLGYLAIAILNTVLRPALAKWHPLLLDYEARRDGSVSQWEHERRWEYGAELRQELNDIRAKLIEYADILAQAAEVPPLILQPRSPVE